MSYRLLLAGQALALDILARRPGLRVAVQGREYDLLEREAPDGAFELYLAGRRYTGWRCVVGDEVHLQLNGRRFVVGLPQTFWKIDSTDKHGYEVHADMPGVVIAVHCEAGQGVQAGDKLVTIESMKLQVSLVASREGTVERVHVEPERSFERGALLVSFQRPATEGQRATGKEAP